MSGSDIDAVAARRAALAAKMAEVDRTRVDLLQEDDGLEVAERVLQRLGRMHYGEPTPLADAVTETRHHSFFDDGLSATRQVAGNLRSALERAPLARVFLASLARQVQSREPPR